MKQPHKTLLLWVVLIVAFLAIWQFLTPDGPQKQPMPFSEFIALVKAPKDQRHVEAVEVKDREYVFQIKNPTSKGPPERGITVGPAGDEIAAELLKSDVRVTYQKDESNPFLATTLTILLPMLFLLVLFYLFMRQLQAGGGKAMSFGKSRARLLNEAQNKVTFADVAGIDEAKDEVEEIIAFLKDPKKFQKLGGRIPKGVLMMGPPGTGKTLLARAIAGEAGVPFFSISGSDFVEMFVGVGASRVRDLFEQGKKHAPCLTGDAVVTLADGRTVTIEEMFERAMVGIDVPAMRDDLSLGTGRVLGITRKRSADIRRVRTMHGEIRATGNHLFPVLRDGRIAWTRADALAAGDFLAMPRALPTAGAVPRPIDLLPEDARVYLDRRQFVRVSEIEAGDELRVRRIARGSGGWTDAELPRIPETTTEGLMYLVGLIDSDGSWKVDRSVPFVNTCGVLHEAVAAIVAESFGTVVRRSEMRRAVGDDRSDVDVSYIHGRLVKHVLVGLRERVLEMPASLVAAWLRGMFDGDGCVQRDKVVISAWDAGTNRRIRAALHRVGIVPFDRGRPGNIEITGKEEVARFAEVVGSAHPEKRRALDALSLGGRTASRAGGIPVGVLLREAREACGMGQRAFAHGNYVSAYERGEVVPPRSRVAALVHEMEHYCAERGAPVPEAVRALERLASGDTRFTRVESVEREPGEAYVYDLCLDEVHNFVANGLFVHNCIIFIDEIDAVGRHRGAGLGGGHDEREQTLNQLLVEMDGFESNEGVIIIAATNRPDVLDPAILRPGRFDRRIIVPRPDVRGREGILAVHTKKVPLGVDVDLGILAAGTPGFVGADLENLVNEAALLAARQDKEAVAMQDFELAKDKVLMGSERRSMVMSAQERRTAAWHEAGHTLVGKLVEGNDAVHKVSVIPRGSALGVTQFLPTEDRHLMTRKQMLARIAMALGGRAAEEISFGEITTGAQDDIKRATRLARAMVCELGMTSKLGPLAWGENEESVFLGREMTTRREDYSEQTAREIDEEVRDIVEAQHKVAYAVLAEHREQLDRVAEALLERETLDSAEITMAMEGQALPPRPRVVIPTWSDKRLAREKEKKRPASIFGAPKPAPSG